MGDLKKISGKFKNNTSKHKMSSKFLTCAEDHFLL